MDGGQTLVAAGDAALSLLFDMPQEGAQQFRIDVGDEQLIYFLMCVGGSEHHQKADGIAIALLSIAGQIPLPDEVFHQEAPDPRTEGRSIVHGALHTRSPGNGGWLLLATPVSSSGNTGSSADLHVQDKWRERAEGPARSHQSYTIPSACGQRTCVSSHEAGADESSQRCGELLQGCTTGGSWHLPWSDQDAYVVATGKVADRVDSIFPARPYRSEGSGPHRCPEEQVWICRTLSRGW